MKVLFVNTFYTSGGAAIAAKRLQESLPSSMNVMVMTQEEVHGHPSIISVSDSPLSKGKSRARFILERIYFMFYESSKRIRFQFSPANTGMDITRTTAFKKADVIHLHWINQGFISLKGLHNILSSGKRIVITLHDFWYFTGGCHYPGTCDGYKKQCGECPYIKNSHPDDLSHQLFLIKNVYYQYAVNIHIVACSEWLKTEAQNSSLFKKLSITSIPNALPVDQFKPLDVHTARTTFNIPQDKKIILFGSMQINDPRKGFIYFKQSLEHLQNHFTTDELEIIVFGNSKNETLSQFESLPFRCHYLGKIAPDSLPGIYAIADVFVHSSLEDNLPNTVAEAMACGIPVVAFNTGGLPEMIDHKLNGYIAEYKNERDLADGIRYVLNHSDAGSLREQARSKALEKYTPSRVAELYMDIYKKNA